jgi:VWFA-related protein
MKSFFLCKFIICIALTLFSADLINAQNVQPTPPADEDVVKITTKLVQMDAVVTDKNGNQVRDLTASDFELLQDGTPQKISSATYVNTDVSAPTAATKSNNKTEKNAALPPIEQSRSSRGGRIITFIVDDGNCVASIIGMEAARSALSKFVTEQMLPNDLISIYRTRGGSSLLQQYTSDKAQLLRVARQIRFYPPSGSCVSYDGDFFQATGKTPITPDKYRDEIRDNQTVGTLGVVSYVVRGLEKVRGRKVVFLLSDGLPIRALNKGAQESGTRRAIVALRDLTDLANRASVVFNTIDVRGIFDETMKTASDGSFETTSIDPPRPSQGETVAGDRTSEVLNTREGLFFLAEETGGNFYKNQNNLDAAIRRALSLEKGYYLIGYEPDDETFKNKEFNKIEIRLKRPDLKVSYRAGFLGKTDESVAPKKRTGDSELYEAIVAPLPRAGLNVRLAAYFVNDPAQGNVVRSLVHLDGNELKFTDESNGFKKAVLDVIAVTLNDKNEVVDEFNRTHTFKFEAAAIPYIKQNGIIYTTDVPVKKAGNYNFRLAVRDENSRLLGSAGQAIQIPDLKKSKIYMSGLIVNATDANGKFAIPSAVKPENALSPTASTAVPAIRRFRPNTILAYAYTLYNAQIDKATNQPKLTVQVNLYRDGKVISEGQPQAAQLEKLTDQTRINDYGYLRINAATQPGDYALQIIVKDALTNEVVSQSIDFEVE